MEKLYEINQKHIQQIGNMERGFKSPQQTNCYRRKYWDKSRYETNGAEICSCDSEEQPLLRNWKYLYEMNDPTILFATA